MLHLPPTQLFLTQNECKQKTQKFGLKVWMLILQHSGEVPCLDPDLVVEAHNLTLLVTWEELLRVCTLPHM